MNVTLKNVRISQSLSRETTAFTATVYVNGKRAFTVSNDGWGGSNLYEALYDGTKETSERSRNLIKAASTYARSLPPTDTPWGTTLSMDLDILIDDILNECERKRLAKKALRGRTIIALTVNGETQLREFKTKPNPIVRAQIKRSYENWTIVNDLPLDEATDLLVAK
jgi:hypothetical protein